MRECTLTTESRVEECGIVAQVVKCAPRVCGDDPYYNDTSYLPQTVLPAYAGMILDFTRLVRYRKACSPRMRG